VIPAVGILAANGAYKSVYDDPKVMKDEEVVGEIINV
jgi:hypothetical protein